MSLVAKAATRLTPAFGNVIFQRGVTIIVEQSGLETGNVLSRSVTVAGRHEHVLPRIHESRSGTAMSARPNPQA
jgi:hypothetical protein